MTVEIADRLIKLRKKYGYSQEELADKLGLSRQAVSKWERAEASPDTDNLICLAKLYGVSLDELLSVDEDIDTIVNEQVKKEENKKEGFHLVDDEGNEVIISNKGVTAKDKKGNKVESKYKNDKVLRIANIIEGALFLIATISYILLGVFLKMWHNGFIVMFIPEIICSLIRAIRKRNANNFNISFVALFSFFFVCMVYPGLDANLWHPMWVVFLAIPLYHVVVSSINKAIDKNEDDNEDDEDED